MTAPENIRSIILEDNAVVCWRSKKKKGSDDYGAEDKKLLIEMNTVIVVTSQIFLIDKEVVIFIEFPKLAIDDVEMLVTEVVSDLVNIFLFFQ